MKIAALYDVFGNYQALQAVLRDVKKEKVDLLILGGNIIWGPHPVEVLSIIDSCELETIIIRGNTERELFDNDGTITEKLGYFSEMYSWCLAKLTKEQKQKLENLAVDFDYENFKFVHASPKSDTNGIRNLTTDEDIEKMMEEVSHENIICGHTYRQFKRQVGKHTIYNAGSVGIQFNTDGACWLLIDHGEVLFKETHYNLTQAAKDMLYSDCPRRHEFASHLLDIPIEQ